MKKLLSLMAVLAIILSCCVMGIGTVASAAEESPEADFIVFDGVLEEYIGPGGDVVLPASLGVTEIAADAMRVNNDITSFVLPEGVEVLGLRAFYQCANLTSITLPYSLYEIGQECFSSCGLTSILIPPQVEMVPYGMCQGNHFLSDIKFSYGVKEIHGGAFGGTIASKVVFPETVELIGGFSFNYVQSNGKVEWIICNPDCEIGYYALGSALEKDWANHNLSSVPRRPINNTLHPVMNVTFVVPKDSAIGEFIEENKDTMLDRDDKYGDKKACDGTTYRVSYKDQSYFDKLEENKEGYGVQEPSYDDTPGEDTPVDPQNPNTQDPNSNQQNNNNNNNNPQYQYAESDNSSMWIILAVVGGLVLLIIIGVVVFLVIYMKKPKAPQAPYGYPPYGYPQYPGYPPVGPDGQPIPPQAPEAPAEAATAEEAVVEEAPVDETPAE